jgi:hypothetical protein
VTSAAGKALILQASSVDTLVVAAHTTDQHGRHGRRAACARPRARRHPWSLRRGEWCACGDAASGGQEGRAVGPSTPRSAPPCSSDSGSIAARARATMSGMTRSSMRAISAAYCLSIYSRTANLRESA